MLSPPRPRPALASALLLVAVLAVVTGLAAGGCAPGAGAASGEASNASCASCHPGQAAAFASSRHAHASGSAIFGALRARAAPADQAFCDGCRLAHQADGEAGVGCVTCHAAAGNTAVRNAELLADPGGPMRGPFDPAPGAAGHSSARSDFVTSADLCGTCHEVQGPGAFVETPYSEWAASPAAPAVTCAACHMASVPGEQAPLATGPAATPPDGSTYPARPLASHRFVGPDDPEGGALLARAVALDLALAGAGADGLHVTATVRNLNAAHAFPSGARFARDVWLEVSVEAADGSRRVVSGDLAPDGGLLAGDPQRVLLDDPLAHAGRFALPLDADPPVPRAVPAGASRTFPFVVPATVGTSRVVAVRLRLRYRTVRHELRLALGVEGAGTLFDAGDVTLPVPP